MGKSQTGESQEGNERMKYSQSGMSGGGEAAGVEEKRGAAI